MLLHTESSIKVYFTSEYSRFRYISGNRQLNQSKINKIQKDIQSGLDVLRYCPILVTDKGNKLEIIDGQHRFWVAKTLKSKVWYIICEDMAITDIAKINSNTEKWKKTDFINAFVQMGNKDYIILQDFIAKWEVPLSIAVRLLKSGTFADGGDPDSKSFERGSFKVKFHKEAEAFMKHASQFDVVDCWNKRGFLVALEKIRLANVVDMDRLIDKVKENPEKVLTTGSYKEYLTNLEFIYNINLRSRKPIY